MTRRVALSAIRSRTLALRASLALAGAIAATGASAQTVTQSLTVNFTGASPVPIGGWVAIGIALVLAGLAGLALRRSPSSGAWIWFAALIGTAGLFALQPIRDVQAAIPTAPLDLVTPPATIVFTFPGAPVETNVVVTNKTGVPTTILSITLGSGPYGTFSIGTPCTVGMVLPANGTCNIGVGES
jgi:hypothetical protein